MSKQGVNEVGVYFRDVYVEHEPVSLDCSHDGMTRQEFAAECDINVLLDRYERTGVLTHYSSREPVYLDLSDGVPDLMTSLAVLQRATDAFMTLPAKVRREFDQDPVKFVSFCENRENLPQLREWGLAPPVPAPPVVAVAAPAAPVAAVPAAGPPAAGTS